MDTSLEIRLFGGLRVAVDGAPVTGFMSAKVPALLAYLAVTGRGQRRDDLAGLLWGEMPDVDAKNNLRQALANLRRSLEPWLIITREEVALDPETMLAANAHAAAGEDARRPRSQQPLQSLPAQTGSADAGRLRNGGRAPARSATDS